MPLASGRILSQVAAPGSSLAGRTAHGILKAMDDADEQIDLVASVGPLDAVVETLRDVLHRSGALRVAVVVDLPDSSPALVDVGRLAPVEVRVGDSILHLPHAIELEAESLGGGIALRQLPPFEVDAESGQVVGTIGGLDMLADAMRALAELLGGRSVAMAQYQTVTPDVSLTVTARYGEAVLVTLGDAEWELPDR
jgi:hypothetical protein